MLFEATRYFYFQLVGEILGLFIALVKIWLKITGLELFTWPPPLSPSAPDGWGEGRRGRVAATRRRAAAADSRRGSKWGAESHAAPAAEPVFSSQGEIQKLSFLLNVTAELRALTKRATSSCFRNGYKSGSLPSLRSLLSDSGSKPSFQCR